VAATVALPLCLAFGVASGIGAEAGLYGAIACGILAAIFGGTPGQCSGPTGPMTVVTASAFAANSARPELVFAGIIMAGLLQLAMGCFKLGKLIHYVPYPVISGFMTGVGMIIVILQIGPFFGQSGSGNVLDSLQMLDDIPANLNLNALLTGTLSLIIIYALPRLSKRIPAPLVALLIATWLSHYLGWQLPRIGEIPSQLPQPSFPTIKLTDLHLLLQVALTLALLGAIDSLLTSLVVDKLTGNRHNSDQELVGQGLGNCISGLFGGLPGAGATMRSVVNVRAGGSTYLSGAIHGFVLLAVLLGLGPVASQIPLSCLAAILITVGFSVMDWRVMRHLKKAPKSDSTVMLVVLALTVFVDLIIAVLAGVALASMLFVKQLSDAGNSSTGDFETLEELRQTTEHIPENVRKSIHSYQLNGPLFFGEAKNLSDAVEKLSEAKYIILRFYNVPLVDQTGAYSLENAIDKWESKGTKVLFVGMQPHIKQTLEATGAIHKIDMQNCFDQFEDAIEAIANFEDRIHGGNN
jgi:sulfate permease, SulP family